MNPIFKNNNEKTKLYSLSWSESPEERNISQIAENFHSVDQCSNLTTKIVVTWI